MARTLVGEAVFPPLPLEEWADTRETLQRFIQIAGKVRLGYRAFQNHWWNVTLYVSSRGLTTGPVHYGDRTFEITFDFIAHELKITSNSGGIFSFPLRDGMSVASFYRELLAGLSVLGIDVVIDREPYKISGEPFDKDVAHASYDREYVERYWRILVQLDSVFKEFSGRFTGKISPAHLFWHSFDFAVARFSGRRASTREDADEVTREAYSHEVIALGFWPGDASSPAPAFYSYTAPEPEGLTEQPLLPQAAYWLPEGGSAFLAYEEVRNSGSPRQTLLDFGQSAYEAGARAAGWDLEAFRYKSV